MPSLLTRRIGAYLIDNAALFAVLAPLGVAVSIGLSIDRGEVTPGGIYTALVLNFSIPVWLYFALADVSASGATLGKRALGLRTDGASPGRALVRTAIKLAPWETVHLAAFGLPALGAPVWTQGVGFGLAYAGLAVLVGVAWRTGGERSLHDLAAGTRVVRTAPALGQRVAAHA